MIRRSSTRSSTQQTLGRNRYGQGISGEKLAWEWMTTTILRILHYPVPAATLTPKQCDAIMAPILQAGLPCSGIVRIIPRVLVYGPIEYQGLGISDLYTSHIERILKYSHLDDDITGNSFGRQWSSSSSR
jgi:hypothetical protein